jgi:hypothetical protein
MLTQETPLMKRLLLVAVMFAAQFTLASTANASHTRGGYWMLTSDGQVHAFGGAAKLGQPSFNISGHVQITPTPSGDGYWVLHASGIVEEFGDAKDLGSSPSLPYPERYASMASTSTGKGYWLFTNRGRVLRFGDAQFYGDMSSVALNGEILDAVVTPTGKGYYMVGSDGGIFNFGDATFHGSTGNSKLNKPVMSMAADPDGAGYWLVASDGGIFAFSAPFHGSMGAVTLNKPISGIVPSPTSNGYLMVAEDGGSFSFGDVPFYGSLGANPPAFPVVAIAAIGVPGPPPVMEWRQIFKFEGTGDQDSAPFELKAEPTSIGWSCIGGASYSAGCIFTLNEFGTGSQVDYTSGNSNQSGTMLAHPDQDTLHYLEVQQYSTLDDTRWILTVSQQVCVANCLT